MSEQLERLSKIRFELLERNPHFLVDFDELMHQIDRDSEEYREKEKIFRKKWSVGGVDIRSLHHVRLIDPVTIIKDADKSGRLTLEIDLRYSRERIQNELKKVVDYWHKDYNEIRKERWLELFTDDRMLDLFDGLTPTLKKEFEQFKEQMSKYDKPELEWGRQQAPEFYELCIKVYDLKVKKNKSYAQITMELGLNSRDNAINHYKTAIRLIADGIPGLPRFHYMPGLKEVLL